MTSQDKAWLLVSTTNEVMNEYRTENPVFHQRIMSIYLCISFVEFAFKETQNKEWLEVKEELKKML